MSLAPGDAGKGIVFRRSDLADREIPALYDKVGETRLGTVIDDGKRQRRRHRASDGGRGGRRRSTILLVTLDGPEPPIFDGDALSYLDTVRRAGLPKETPGARVAHQLKTR